MSGIDFFKNTFFTSDWHLGHENVLKFCKNTRKVSTLDEMYDILIKNYNNTIKSTNTCYFLGDYSFDITIGKEVLSKLNGKKICVRGNHDKGHQSLLNMGFDAVLDSVSWKVADKYITASHFPLKGIWREDCSQFKNYNGKDNWHGEYKYMNKFNILNYSGQDIHLHGHLHSPRGGVNKKIEGVQFDVGVDANNMTPLSLNNIIKQINRGG